MISIGDYCMIAPSYVIIGSNHIFENVAELIKLQGIYSKGIVIKENVWIGANTVVLDGVIIGEGCVIGAGSVVIKNMPPYSIAVGNPCKIIKMRI